MHFLLPPMCLFLRRFGFGTTESEPIVDAVPTVKDSGSSVLTFSDAGFGGDEFLTRLLTEERVSNGR
ncbi:hypothetical protein CEXT_235161, partial [Caerostris extrusa]